MHYFIYALFLVPCMTILLFLFPFVSPHTSFSLVLVVVLNFGSLPPTSHTSPSLTPLFFPPPLLFLFPSLLLSPSFCSSPFPLAPLSFWPSPPPSTLTSPLPPSLSPPLTLNPNFPLAPLFPLLSPLFLLLLPPS